MLLESLIVTLSELNSGFKLLWRVGLTTKRHKKRPYLYISITYSGFKCLQAYKKIGKYEKTVKL